MTGVRFPAEAWKRFYLATASRQTLGPIYPLSRGYPEISSFGVKWEGLVTNTHLHLMPRLRMRGAIPPTPFAFIM
jgi:hypothetical protein